MWRSLSIYNTIWCGLAPVWYRLWCRLYLLIKLGSAISYEYAMHDDGDGAAEASFFLLVSTNVQINTSDIECLAVVLI